jgi:DnaD/phage-associated family protein
MGYYSQAKKLNNLRGENMSDVKMKIGYTCSSLELPVAFIDDYMADCLPVYPLVYIWSLRRVLDGESVTFQEIGERFQLTEGDVIKAWRHWEKENLVSISSAKTDMEITFLPVTPKVSGFERTLKLHTSSVGDAVPQAPSPRPQYTAQELACYRSESRDVERLFSRAEKTLGKLLTYNDMNVIFGFHDWLRLPIEVIEYLLTYCEENEKRSLRYIEKCAMDWADNNIDELEKALLYVQNFDRDYKLILQHMGQISSYPTPAQRKYINKWLNELNMPIELITEAIDRCIEKINKFDKKYTEKILTEWHKKNISSLEEIAAADEEFSGEKFTRPSVKAKPNRFANFNQRGTDYSQYEKLERDYLNNKYNSNYA